MDLLVVLILFFTLASTQDTTCTIQPSFTLNTTEYSQKVSIGSSGLCPSQQYLATADGLVTSVNLLLGILQC
jgi:hypothetical protein